MLLDSGLSSGLSRIRKKRNLRLVFLSGLVSICPVFLSVSVFFGLNSSEAARLASAGICKWSLPSRCSSFLLVIMMKGAKRTQL
jgi:hypothetical protein